MTLEYMAMSWLRFEKNCPIALFERTPRYGHGEPDVLGITRDKYLLEIEIKRSVQDFKANSKKFFHRCRDLQGMGNMDPSMFWFLTPHDLTEKVLPLVPEWAGLMRGPRDDEVQQIVVVKKGVINPKAMRLTTKECVRLAKCMANQILSMARQLSGQHEWDHHNSKWIKQDYEI